MGRCPVTAAAQSAALVAAGAALYALYARWASRKWELPTRRLLDKAVLLAQRQRDFCPAQSISYAKHGHFSWLVATVHAWSTSRAAFS